MKMNWRSALSTLYRSPLLQPKHTNLRRLIQRNTTMATSVKETQKERDTFSEFLPSLLDSIEKHPVYELPDVQKWMRKMLEFNLTGGKLNRGLATVFAYEMLEKSENITEESMRSARVLGWCVEMLQAYFLVVDDIMDGSSTRRGRPCWYRMPEVGLGALNDAQLLTCVLFQLMKDTFGTSPNYLHMVHLFHDALFNTSIGQHMDTQMVFHSKINYNAFNLDRWELITKYKTSYYTFNLPVALAMFMANITSEAYHKMAEDICFSIGALYQLQDDYLDAFVDESISGKAGTDIQEGKCSWVAVTAFNKCSPKQKVVFQSCFMSKEPAHVERIKYLYEQLNIRQDYLQEETRLYNLILNKIRALPDDMSPALFTKLVDMIYKRKL